MTVDRCRRAARFWPTDWRERKRRVSSGRWLPLTAPRWNYGGLISRRRAGGLSLFKKLHTGAFAGSMYYNCDASDELVPIDLSVVRYLGDYLGSRGG